MARLITATIAIRNDAEDIQWFVEAKENRRWKNVAGPFAKHDDALKEAIRYAKAHLVQTRVVGEQ